LPEGYQMSKQTTEQKILDFWDSSIKLRIAGILNNFFLMRFHFTHLSNSYTEFGRPTIETLQFSLFNTFTIFNFV